MPPIWMPMETIFANPAGKSEWYAVGRIKPIRTSSGHGRSSEEVSNVVRMSDSKLTRLPPPTSEERERALAALDRIERRHKEMLAAREGRYFPSAVEVLREIRGEQDEDAQ